MRTHSRADRVEDLATRMGWIGAARQPSLRKRESRRQRAANHGGYLCMTVEPAEVEAYLLARTGWVSAEELCRVFNVGERAFRGLRKRPGLCSGFAISGDHGFKHVELATTGEWLRFKGR